MTQKHLKVRSSYVNTKHKPDIHRSTAIFTAQPTEKECLLCKVKNIP